MYNNIVKVWNTGTSPYTDGAFSPVWCILIFTELWKRQARDAFTERTVFIALNDGENDIINS